MTALLWFLLRLLVSPFRPAGRLEAENAALRHQVIVLQRKVRGHVEFTRSDRLFLVLLYRWFPSVLNVIADANFREGNDTAGRRRLYGTRPRAVLAERKMRSGVIDSVRPQRSDHRLARLMRTRHAGVVGGRRAYGCAMLLVTGCTSSRRSCCPPSPGGTRSIVWRDL